MSAPSVPSPPPTPSTETPHNASEWRFRIISSPTEWIERYRPGSFHPVHIGDLFSSGRYRVIRKLGNGSFGTVWLALDQHQAADTECIAYSSHRYVALKILRSAQSATGTELERLSRLQQDAAGRSPGSSSVVAFLDHFHHDGPNGRHLCLVFEALGPHTAAMKELLPWNKSRRAGFINTYPVSMAKSILRQALLGLKYLHSIGLAHGDLQPNNILFVPKNIDQVPEEELRQKLDRKSVSTRVKRIDGKEDRWAPRYLALDMPLVDYVDLGPDFSVKLSDLGEAFQSSNPTRVPCMSTVQRPPEVILGLPFNEKIDIWCIGCLLFEYTLGVPLFSLWLFDGEQADDSHLMQMCDKLGPLPDTMFEKWSRAKEYFGPDRERIRIEPLSPAREENPWSIAEPCKITPASPYWSDEESVGSSAAKVIEGAERPSHDAAEYCPDPARQGTPTGDEFDDTTNDRPDFAMPAEEEEVIYETHPPIETIITKHRNKDRISDSEANEIIAVLRYILRYDPAERPSAEQLLAHPWFAE